MSLPPKTVYLMYSEGAGQYAWWERFLNKAHAHVDLLVFTPGHGVLLQSYAGHLEINDLELPMARSLIARWPGPVVHFNVGTRRRRKGSPVGFTSCVELAKAVIGCNDWRVMSPLQLKRWALNNGGLTVGR